MAIEYLKDASSDAFAFERHHQRDAGIMALPVYGNPPRDQPQFPNGGTDQFTRPVPVPCRIVRLHAPIETVIIVWHAAKSGAAPIVPNPYLFDPNLVF